MGGKTSYCAVLRSRGALAASELHSVWALLLPIAAHSIHAGAASAGDLALGLGH